MPLLIIPVMLIGLTLTAAIVSELVFSDSSSDEENRSEKGKKFIYRWKNHHSYMKRVYEYDVKRFSEYNGSFIGKIRYLADGFPNLWYVQSRIDLLNGKLTNYDGIGIPFHRERGLWVLKKSWLNSDDKYRNFESAKLFIEMIAQYDAKYCTLTGSDNFYRNTFGENTISNIYNQAFLKELKESMKEIVRKDVESNSMNMGMLKSKLMKKVYQESYVELKASNQAREDHRRDNLEALAAIQQGASVSPEEFRMAFGDAETVMVEFPNNKMMKA